MEHSAEKYDEDTNIPAHSEPLTLANLAAHQMVVFVRRVTQQKRPNDRQETNKQYKAFRPIRVSVPGEAKKKECVGIAVQYGIQPFPLVAGLELESRHFAIAAVDHRGKLRENATQDKSQITVKGEQTGSKYRK